MTDLDTALKAPPDDPAWTEICRHAEGLPAAAVAEAADRLRAWPDRLRPMPDRWWAQRQAGDRRPWHALATHRRLCRLGEYFYVSVAACPNDLGLLLAGSGATGNSDLGTVMLLRPTPEAAAAGPSDEDGLLVATPADQTTAVDALFSPDGSHVTVGFTDFGGGDVDPVVYAADGRCLHGFALDEIDGIDEVDHDFTRVGQSGDGRLIVYGSPAAGTATVAEVSTGKVLMSAEEATGAVALDTAGGLLAYASPSGRVTVRAVPSGELLSTWDTGLAAVNALAFSPDARALVAAGGDRPTACLLTLDGGVSQVTASDPALALHTSPFAGFAARASWTDRGPQVFLADDNLAVLMDGTDGRVRWMSRAGQVTGSFTPDGRVLVASTTDGVVDAWFLDSLAMNA